MNILPLDISERTPFILPEAARTRARTGRGTGGKTWWGRQWLNVVQECSPRQALDQGRRDSRRGRVTDVTIVPGCITANVADDGGTYQPRLCFQPLNADQVTQVVEVLNSAASYAADLLAGQLPDDLPQILAKVGGRCLPESPDEPDFHCGCDDEGDCCRHAAALGLVIAETLDEDPFLLLTLRGIDRDELMAEWRRVWGLGLDLEPAPVEEPVKEEPPPPTGDGFYELCAPLPEPWEPAETSTGKTSEVIELLGFPPFFPAGDRTVMQTLDNLYDLNDANTGAGEGDSKSSSDDDDD